MWLTCRQRGDFVAEWESESDFWFSRWLWRRHVPRFTGAGTTHHTTHRPQLTHHPPPPVLAKQKCKHWQTANEWKSVGVSQKEWVLRNCQAKINPLRTPLTQFAYACGSRLISCGSWCSTLPIFQHMCS